MLTVASAAAALPYKDYYERFPPKSSERRRVAVAMALDFEGSDRRIPEIDLLDGFLLTHFKNLSGVEHVPRTFSGNAKDLMSELRAMEVDDLVTILITKIKAPDTQVKQADRYDVQGKIKLVNVKTGTVVAETDFEKANLPVVSEFGEKIDQAAGTADALAAYIASFYQGNGVLLKAQPTCTAMDAAAAAEASNQYAEAYRIYSEIIRREPAQEAALRDKRDLAKMRSGQMPLPSNPDAAATPDAPATVSRGIDYLDPAQHGKMFPVTNGSVPVRSQVSTSGFEFSVVIMTKDPRGKGGILIGGKTRNIYIALSPESSGLPAVLDITAVNNVTTRADSHPFDLPHGLFPVNKQVRLTLRYDGSTLSFQINNQDVAQPISNAALNQASIFFFAKLSTIYVQDAELSQ
ncbi:MAG: hypothetical protein U0166_18975 [Acidobacteriota bacterium]